MLIYVLHINLKASNSLFLKQLSFGMKKIFILLICLLSVEILTAQEAPEGLFIGSKAPDFKAKDQNGNEIRLKDLLKKGKVVLVFYRGQWCPYCNRELSRIQDSLQFFTDKGATVLAVSPEKQENISITVEKTKAEFSVLYDEDLKIMKAYDVEFEVPENTLTRYRNANIDVEKNNGKNGKYLPVPAVYIIDKEATVTYRFFDADYKKRPTVNELLKNL
jgi:peroxiredoxin